MIKLFAMDVDGTLTDGGIYMDGAGGEMKRCDVQDGHKLPELEKIAAEFGASAAETAYAGDDLPDIDCIRWAGLGIAVANARPEVLEAARYVTRSAGGRGAIRECADMILRINDGENIC